ncbi:MAG: hypothetical protein ACTSU9_17335 [Promethearchaeota archaeon]
MARTGTETSDFGVSKREGHDSSKFYASRLYEGMKINDKQKIIDKSSSIKANILDKVHSYSDETVASIPSTSIHLIIYQAPKFDDGTFSSPYEFIEQQVFIFSQLKEKLIIGGRLIVILDDEVKATVSRSCYWPFHAYLAPEMIKKGLYMRGEVILKKQVELNGGRDRGKQLRSAYYHGLIFSNQVSRRIRKDKKGTFEKTDSITRDQFLEYTKSMWKVNLDLLSSEEISNSNDIEKLDYISRFIHLYSFIEDTIMLILPEHNKINPNIINSYRKRNIIMLMKK